MGYVTRACKICDFDAEFQAYKCAVRSIDVSPDGRRIAASYDDGVIRVFDIAEAKLEGEYFTDERHNNDIVKIAYNSNGSLLGSISNDTVRVWSSSCEVLMVKPKITKSQVLTTIYWRGASSLSVTAC